MIDSQVNIVKENGKIQRRRGTYIDRKRKRIERKRRRMLQVEGEKRVK